MRTIFFAIALLFFFFAGLSVTIIPNPLAWGLACLALGLLAGDWQPVLVSRQPSVTGNRS